MRAAGRMKITPPSMPPTATSRREKVVRLVFLSRKSVSQPPTALPTAPDSGGNEKAAQPSVTFRIRSIAGGLSEPSHHKIADTSERDANRSPLDGSLTFRPRNEASLLPLVRWIVVALRAFQVHLVATDTSRRAPSPSVCPLRFFLGDDRVGHDAMPARIA